jgi:hypothetical protein
MSPPSEPRLRPGSAPISTSTTVATLACVVLGVVLLLDAWPENCIFMLKLAGLFGFLHTLLWKRFTEDRIAERLRTKTNPRESAGGVISIRAHEVSDL